MAYSDEFVGDVVTGGVVVVVVVVECSDAVDTVAKLLAVDDDLEAVVGRGPFFVGAFLVVLFRLCLVAVGCCWCCCRLTSVRCLGVAVICVLLSTLVLWYGIRGPNPFCSFGGRWFARCLQGSG